MWLQEVSKYTMLIQTEIVMLHYLCPCCLVQQYQKQVDILTSKNQVLQILYLKYHVYKTS